MTVARRLGRLSAEERAAHLCDPGTFAREAATLQSYTTAPPGDGLVCGTGLVGGRPVAVIATDGRILRGTIGSAAARTATRLLEGARRSRHPVVLLLDSDGARQSEGIAAVLGNAQLLHMLADLGGHVPRLGAVFGAAGGSAAYALALTDLAVGIADRSFAFVAGPAVITQALGEVTPLTAFGTELHLRTGLLHDAVDDDHAALGWLRAALHALPSSASHNAPTTRDASPAATDQPGFDPRAAATWLPSLVDTGSWLELGAAWGPSIRTGFARLSGRALLIVASSPHDLAGAIDANASRKLARFVRMATAFNLPILTLCDTPGFLPGLASERAAVLCHGAAVISAYSEAHHAVPRVAVVVRRAIGAGSVLAALADVVFALPDNEVAQMGDAALQAAAAASGVAASTQPSDAEASGFAQRTVAPEALRDELVHAFARLPHATPMPPGQRRMALFPL